MKFSLEGGFCGFSRRKNASEGLLRVIFRSYAAGGPRSCVDSADCDSEGDESSPGPAPAAPARADRASGEHRCCDKKLPIPNSSGIEAFPDFEPGKQHPVRSAPRSPTPATLAQATTFAQY